MLIHGDDADESDESFAYAELLDPYLASWSERAPLETIERAAETIDRLARRIEDVVLPHRPELAPV